MGDGGTMGEAYHKVPPAGRTLVLEIDGTKWRIRPSIFAVWRVAAVFARQPEPPPPAPGSMLPPPDAEPMIACGQALLEHYAPAELRTAFEGWTPERQREVLDRLRAYHEEVMGGGEEAAGADEAVPGPDPTPTSPASSPPPASEPPRS